MEDTLKDHSCTMFYAAAGMAEQERQIFNSKKSLLVSCCNFNANRRYQEISNFRLALTVSTYLVATFFFAKLALAQDAPTLTLSQIEIPAGPYASWPDDIRGKTVAALTHRCTLVSTMRLGNYSGSKEAASEIFQAMSAWCVVKQMPDDWPDRAKLLESRDLHLATARKLDKTLQLPPP